MAKNYYFQKKLRCGILNLQVPLPAPERNENTMKRMLALILAVSLLLCACGSKPAETTAPPTTVPETTAPALQAAPDFTVYDAEGKAIKLSDFINKNKYTLVSIWDSRNNTYPTYVIPHLKRAYQTYKKQGLEIVGISLDKDSTTWTTTIEKWDMPWPQMSDLKGRQSQACELYNINLIPYQMLIDQNGIILARNIKPDKLNEDLGKILK